MEGRGLHGSVDKNEGCEGLAATRGNTRALFSMDVANCILRANNSTMPLRDNALHAAAAAGQHEQQLQQEGEVGGGSELGGGGRRSELRERTVSFLSALCTPNAHKDKA